MASDHLSAGRGSLEKIVDFARGAVEYRHHETGIIHVQHQILTHDRETDQTDIRLRHHLLPCEHDCGEATRILDAMSRYKPLLMAAGLLSLIPLLSHAAEPPRPISAHELWAQIETSTATLIVDVRTPEEFVSGHVPGAINVPIGELESRLGELSPHREAGVVVYCERGPRAGYAVSILERSAFGNIRYLKGHMALWRNKGLPIE